MLPSRFSSSILNLKAAEKVDGTGSQAILRFPEVSNGTTCKLPTAEETLRVVMETLETSPRPASDSVLTENVYFTPVCRPVALYEFVVTRIGPDTTLLVPVDNVTSQDKSEVGDKSHSTRTDVAATDTARKFGTVCREESTRIGPRGE